MQTKVGSCLVTIIAIGGETSLNQDNLRLIPSFLILNFLYKFSIADFVFMQLVFSPLI